MIEQWIDVLRQGVRRSTHNRVVVVGQYYAVIAECRAHRVQRRRRWRVGVFNTLGQAGVAHLSRNGAAGIRGTWHP